MTDSNANQPSPADSADQLKARSATSWTRIWGLIILAAGLWFFAQVTLDLPLPTVAWGELWPAALVVLGLAIITRGMARRT